MNSIHKLKVDKKYPEHKTILCYFIPINGTNLCGSEKWGEVTCKKCLKLRPIRNEVKK